MRTKSLTALAASIGVILTASTTQVMAQGFALNEQDIAGLGMAYAGRAASSNNASVVATNPAAISRLQGINLTTNATLFFAESVLNDAAGSTQGTNRCHLVPVMFLGSTFITVQNFGIDNLSFGFGIYAPAGLKTNYEDTFQGRAFGDKSVVTVATFQPTLSYSFAPNFSVGAGLTINHINGVLSSGLSPYVPNSTNVSKELAGSDNALGYNLGILYSPIPDLDLGLTYHSKVDYSLKGSSEVINSPTPIPGVSFYARGDGSLEVTTPDSLELAASFKIVPTVKLNASVVRTRWSTIKDLNPSSNFTAAGITLVPQLTGPLAAQVTSGILANLKASNSSEHLNFKDVNMYSLGAEWLFNPKLTLRAGVGYDETPVQDEYRNVRLPTADRTMFSVGANYKFTDNTSVDIGYMYFFEADAKINETKPDALVAGAKDAYKATFQNSANLVGLQLNHKF